MITNKCPEKYMTTIKHRITKYIQCEPLALLTKLYTKYGTTTSSNITANFNLMTSSWNPPTPIYDLFQQINDGKDFAEEVNEIINDSQLLRLCYDNVHASGLFKKTLKTWREKPDINKTYAKIVPFMIQQEEYRLSIKQAYRVEGFSNTMVDDIVHGKIQEFINQMGPFYQAPSEE